MIIFLLALILAFTVFDILQTQRGLKSKAIEKNPIARWLFGRFGFGKTAMLKLAITGAIMGALLLYDDVIATLIFAAAVALPCLNNMIILRLQEV